MLQVWQAADATDESGVWKVYQYVREGRVRTTQTRGFTFIEKRKNNMAKKRKKKRGRKKIVLFVFEILVFNYSIGCFRII